jgi:hypothetical protein
MVEDEFHDDDDSALAPFVDALSSALIIMVLIAIFFLLQSATSVIDLAKKVTVTNMTVEEERPPFNPVVFRKPIKVDFEENKIVYLLNFRLEPAEIAHLNAMLRDSNQINIKIVSSESPEKVTSMLIHFLSILEDSNNKKINTTFEIVTDNVSVLTWEGI